MAVAVAGLKKKLMFALAVMTADPEASPVTGTDTVVAPAAKVPQPGPGSPSGSA
jgi:hypothetical protein